jgi:hypothetical protein
MKMAGGILAIIAGAFGIIAALITLGIGGIGANIGASDANAIGLLGLGGLIFSVLVIVLGGLCIKARKRMVPVFLIGASIAGAVLGGGFVAFCMLLSMIGGIIALIGTRPNAADSPKT